KGTSDIDDSSIYNPSANTLTDNRDGHTYKTVTIGTQTWMAENLNYAYTGVKYYEDDSTSWCYNGEKSNCDTYGRLYTWSAAMDSAGLVDTKNKVANSSETGTGCGYSETCTPNTPHRGICPEGWHVPTNAEYSTLYTTIGGTDYAGIYLKSTDKWYSNASAQGIDFYGFSVLPAGNRNHNDYFRDVGRYAYLWSASEDGFGLAYRQFFLSYDAKVYQFGDSKNDGYSLRCLQD
ncbi:MAG: fibrobacter succinogenes major paralogous domain-containing protein, partial [Fibrobacteraceae bacterium]|nr:fibrobacter succinogenes major paralogous domain-containing protein [Fibrobacteraceae bacterium]